MSTKEEERQKLVDDLPKRTKSINYSEKKKQTFVQKITDIVKPRLKKLYNEDDWISNYIGVFFFLLSFIPFINKFHPAPHVWIWKQGITAYDFNNALGLFIISVCVAFLMIIVILVQKKIDLGTFFPGFLALIIIVLLSQFLGANSVLKSYGFGYPIWALLSGIFVANYASLFTSDLKCPEYIKAGSKANLYIKIGLVLLGVQDIKVVTLLGLQGIFVSVI